jgi:hypothetical protein
MAMVGSPRRRLRLSLTTLIALIAAIAVCLHVDTLRVRDERRRQFRPIARKAARLYDDEAIRLERRIISFERKYAREMPYWLALFKESGHEAEARGGDEYIASLRDILPWHERWLDQQRKAKSYYLEFDGGGSPKPERAMELARAQAELLEERLRLIAHHPRVADLRVPNPWTVKPSSMRRLPKALRGPYIHPPDPFDIQDAPDFTRPGHTFKDIDSSKQ